MIDKPWCVSNGNVAGITCAVCGAREICKEICPPVEAILPSMERGRLDFEDLPRIWRGRIVTRAILDNTELLTELQQKIVQMYYRECLLQKEIGEALNISQQAVGDHLKRIRDKIGKHLKISHLLEGL
jgi:RNA polymerase sigma factor (sigma-70 family)